MTSNLKSSLAADNSLLVDGQQADAGDVIAAINSLLTLAKNGRASVSPTDTHVKDLIDAIVGVTNKTRVVQLSGGANEQLQIDLNPTGQASGKVPTTDGSNGWDWAKSAVVVKESDGSPSIAASDTLSLGPGHVLTEPVGGTAQVDLTSPLVKVRNASGATANQYEVGYLDFDATYGMVFKKTTAQGLGYVAWCVVEVGGADATDIYVVRRGRTKVKLNANNNIGDKLITSTTAGQAAPSAAMFPAVFAVALSANGAGAGGTCDVMLLTGTEHIWKVQTDTNDLYQANASSSTAFVATINGAPSTTSVVYNAPSQGAANAIVPGQAGALFKARLYNTTRGNFRLITAVNTGTNTITTVASTDNWANGDTLTIESQTITTGVANKMMDLDASQSTIIPAFARAIIVEMIATDTGGNGAVWLHPFETYGVQKVDFTNVASTTINTIKNSAPLPINAGVIGMSVVASGAGTGSGKLRLLGFLVAVP
jgi:hypothetical protein